MAARRKTDGDDGAREREPSFTFHKSMHDALMDMSPESCQLALHALCMYAWDDAAREEIGLVLDGSGSGPDVSGLAADRDARIAVHSLKGWVRGSARRADSGYENGRRSGETRRSDPAKVPSKVPSNNRIEDNSIQGGSASPADAGPRPQWDPRTDPALNDGTFDA